MKRNEIMEAEIGNFYFMKPLKSEKDKWNESGVNSGMLR